MSDLIQFYREKLNARLFPLRKCQIGDPNSKRPLFEGWPNTDLNSYTNDELRDYLERGHGIGWAIDHDWIVVDVDVPTRERPNKRGDETIREIEERFGLKPSLEVVTKTGGRHIYYYKPAHIEIRKLVREFPDVDFLSIGCFVVIAGSPHWQGGEYRFQDPEAPIEAISDELLEAIRKRKNEASEYDPEDLRADVELVSYALQGLDPIGSEWRSIAMACHHATNGSLEMREVLKEWSARDPEFADYGEMIDLRWDSFSADSENPVTIATLIDILQDQNPEHYRDWKLKQAFGFEPFEGFPVEEKKFRFDFVRIQDLIERHPKERDPVINGLLREGEVGNFVAATKVGKSWLALGLAHSVAWGLPWLGSFETVPGDVLYVDNELHVETIASRGRKVRYAMDPFHDGRVGGFDVYFEAVRGKSWNLVDLQKYFVNLTKSYGRQRFKLIVLDALYRFLPEGNDENSNGAAKDVMNALDAMAKETGTAILAVMHSPKGDMSGRDVRDLHAGAGSFARAADLQVGIRQHEEEDHFVVEMINRSFAPREPLTIERKFPIFVPSEREPMVALGKTRAEIQAERRDADGVDEVVRILEADGPLTQTGIRKKWNGSVNVDRLKKLIDIAIGDQRVEISHREKPKRSLHEVDFFRVVDADIQELF